MRGAIPPLPQYAFTTWCSVKKHRENFTFLPFAVIYLDPVQIEVLTIILSFFSNPILVS
jgi:hypothetical protein